MCTVALTGVEAEVDPGPVLDRALAQVQRDSGTRGLFPVSPQLVDLRFSLGVIDRGRR